MATSPDEHRPDPEELLDRYQLRDTGSTSDEVDATTDIEGPQRRGRLRIYLGMAAGVGKTYAMLNEGRRRRSRGADVIVGFVETHQRPITEQQIADLEIIPRKKIPYRSVTLEEMDVEAILARHPQVVLVDELAHTNAPGSRNEKRYQDVEDLLDAGISVISTLNVQHLESLNDIVESITGVRQRETLPDKILDEADEIELIDIAPDALRSRLRHGNIYPADRIQQALNSYFSISNLTALRELALRRTAEKTEDQLEQLMRHPNGQPEPLWGTTATERVMVAFDGRTHAQQLLRTAWRLAHSFKAPLLAVTVVRGVVVGGKPDAATQEVARLAADLGADVLMLEGKDVAATLARAAREFHATQIVIGQPMRTRWQEFWRPSVVNRLLRQPTGAAVYVVPNQPDAHHDEE
jgi:two-component system sensor histidine kinase KdpD